MAVTQYIGARYVPNFYENSDGTEDWRSGVEYEPLTIVTYNGNSYTSKKPVPSNIGNPSENTAYWVSTGNYSQQVEAYRQEVQEYKAESDEKFDELQKSMYTFKNHRVLFIGDSYAAGWTPDGDVPKFPDVAAGVLGLAAADYKNVYMGGIGFAHVHEGNTFISLLNSANMTDPDTVTDVVVIGGYNDIGQNDAAVKAAIASFKARANVLYPNAKVWVGYVGLTGNASNKYQASLMLRSYSLGSQMCGAAYMNGIEYVLHNYNWFASDNYHPNATGQNAIAWGVVSALLTGSVDTYIPFLGVGIENAENVSHSNLNTMSATVNNSITNVISQSAVNIDFSTPVTISGGAQGTTRIELGTITGGAIVGSNYDTALCACSCALFVSGDKYYQCGGNILFKNRKVYLMPFALNSAGNGWFMINNVTSIALAPFTGAFDSALC